jgi:hypothetical protein
MESKQSNESTHPLMKERTGVRIFYFSMNVEEAVKDDDYHIFSRRLDHIAQENDVIFVISAGNVDPCRQEWPNDTTQALSILANATHDKIRVPAESVRNLSVAAINPPSVAPAIEHAPAASRGELQVQTAARVMARI